ncbi:MAG: hypothetical protein LBJ38_02750 [Oscillospiraceae bacterium]|jgi:flagellar basal body rod protein FlgG|nr:hypothetical protein [Oscillospiraceae bacterium]
MINGFDLLVRGLDEAQLALDISTKEVAGVEQFGCKATMCSRIPGAKRVVEMEPDGSFVGVLTDSPQITKRTNWQPGGVEETGRSLDVAILGSGFFAARRPDGMVVALRAGRFVVTPQGGLCDLATGWPIVAADGEAIPLATDQVTIDEDGTITGADGEELGRLGVFLTDLRELEKNEDGCWSPRQMKSMPREDVHLRSGCLEASNVKKDQAAIHFANENAALQLFIGLGRAWLADAKLLQKLVAL